MKSEEIKFGNAYSISPEHTASSFSVISIYGIAVARTKKENIILKFKYSDFDSLPNSVYLKSLLANTRHIRICNSITEESDEFIDCPEYGYGVFNSSFLLPVEIDNKFVFDIKPELTNNSFIYEIPTTKAKTIYNPKYIF